MNCPLPRHKDVNRDKSARRRLPRTQSMEIYSIFAIFVHYGLNRLLIIFRQGRIHESSHGTADQSNSRPNDIDGDYNSDQWIKNLPTREARNRNTANYTHRSPHIGHKMMRICFQSDGLTSLTL